MGRTRRKTLAWAPAALACQLLLGLVGHCVVQAATRGDFKTVSEIGEAMYEDQKFFGGCYKLLNATGPVGCSAPSAQPVTGVLALVEDVTLPLTEPRALLVGSLQAQSFLAHLQTTPSAQANVQAVLVYDNGIPANASAALPFPGGAEYAPYPASPSPYVWNPYGSAVALHYLPFPVFQLSATLTQDSVWRGEYNAQNDFKGSMHWMQAQLTMDAVQPTSYQCIPAGTCQPLGGFNVWAAMPPLPVNASVNLPTRSGKPVTLVTAQIDSNGFFHDSVQAADNPLSGLIALITAMKILADGNQTSTYERQLVFAALAGEPWGFMGSKWMLWDMATAQASGVPSNYTAGLELDDVDQVIEMGQVGRGFNPLTNTTTLYIHRQQGAPWGDASNLVANVMGAAAAAVFEPHLGSVSANPASATNPGIPPSSLSSFLRVKPSIAGVIITEFDTQYTNPYAQSSYDTTDYTTPTAIATSALVLARTLHQLAAPTGAPALTVNATTVMAQVNALLGCLAMDSPGMSCPLATALLNPDLQVTDQVVSYAVKHYLGVLQFVHPNPQDPFYKKTVYRFLWNYMGLLASTAGPGAPCAFNELPCAANQACIGWRGGTAKRTAQLGTCFNTTVRYTLSVSTALNITPSANTGMWYQITNASASWEATHGWPADPLWTESNWPATTPFVRVVQQESTSTEWAVLGAGLGVCALTAALSWWGRHKFEQHLKPH